MVHLQVLQMIRHLLLMLRVSRHSAMSGEMEDGIVLMERRATALQSDGTRMHLVGG